MSVQIRSKQQALRKKVAQQELQHFKTQAKKKELQECSSFDSIQKSISQEKSYYIFILSERIRREGVQLQMSCKDQFWLLEFMLSCTNEEIRVSLYLLLLSLKIKCNYLYQITKFAWERTEVVEYLSFYSESPNVVNLRSSEFIELIIFKAGKTTTCYLQFYLDILARLANCLNDQQKSQAILLVNSCLYSQRQYLVAKAAKLALIICELSVEIVQKCIDINRVIELASDNLKEKHSQYCFSVIRSIISQSGCFSGSKVGQTLLNCLKLRLSLEDQETNQEVEEVISYISQSRICHKDRAQLLRNIPGRYRKYSNKRVKEYILKSLSQGIVHSDEGDQTMEELLNNKEEISRILLESLHSYYSTEMITDGLSSLLAAMSEKRWRKLQDQLLAEGLMETLENLADHPAEEISQMVEKFIKVQNKSTQL